MGSSLPLLLFPFHLLGYIGPGTGSLIIQVVIASLVGGLFVLKVYWRRIKSHNTVKAAMTWLFKNGFIHTCGTVKIHGHAVNMFCIGPSDGLRRARKSEPEVNVADVVSVGEVLKVL